MRRPLRGFAEYHNLTASRSSRAGSTASPISGAERVDNDLVGVHLLHQDQIHEQCFLSRNEFFSIAKF